MTADLLREAAAEMREQAEAATPGPWVSFATRQVVGITAEGQRIAYIQKRASDPGAQRNAEHIASWHPAVALAVADWLDDVAEYGFPDGPVGSATAPNAFAVARAYLGRDS